MATSNQSKKRIRQNEKRRLRNKARTSGYKSAVKALLTAATAGDQKKVAELLPATLSKIDKAAKSGVIHANTAARRKSLVMRAARDLANKKV